VTAVVRIQWRETDAGLVPVLPEQPDVEVVWAPQPGSQELFLACPVTEALFEGNRGGGKTLCLLMDFAQHVGHGFGAAWRGILFRREFTQLRDAIDKAIEWFPRLWPEATYNRSEHYWTWPTGEKLFFAQMEREDDYHKYHGWGLAWIGWEELTTWASPTCYQRMFSTLRSAQLGMPRKVRATTNPLGSGHNWVKHRFGLPIPPGRMAGPIIEDPVSKVRRVAIRSRLAENRILLNADRDYVNRIRASASSPQHLKAWLEGSWDLVSGGMFDDIWLPAFHVVPPIPIASIPSSWRLDRAYDDGQSKPFSVGWWAQSSGEPVTWEGRRLGEVRGDLIRVQEWYGWTGQPNEGVKLSSREIAKGIVEREKAWGVRGRVRSGPADGNIFNADPRDPGASIASDMAKEGVSWEKADKRPGSRKQGWAQMRQMLKEAIPDHGRREKPGLFVSALCAQFLRTVPVLPRDEKDPDDVDTEAEDHVADETRYRCRRPRVVETRTPHLMF
jgi:hypothetical protein